MKPIILSDQIAYSINFLQGEVNRITQTLELLTTVMIIFTVLFAVVSITILIAFLVFYISRKRAQKAQAPINVK